ncbi:MAG: flagellin [Terracidiphilus sp.]
MSLTVLNNISSLTAENALSNTQANLQKTLTQLSTGMKINSGSDDAAGLSIVSGLNANIAALTQSQQNAANGIGLLQTADGALSQVTTLLNRAVTLATEGSTSGITASQSQALDTEFQSILSEINQIGNATNFNGSNVFASNAPSKFVSTQGTIQNSLEVATVGGAGTALTAGKTTTVTETNGDTFSYTAKAGDTTGNLIQAINNAAATGVLTSDVVASNPGDAVFNVAAAGGELASITTNDTALNSVATPVTGSHTTLSFDTADVTDAAPVANTNATVLTTGSVTTIQDAATGGTFVFKAAAGNTLATLNTALGQAVAAGTLSAGTTGTINASGQLSISNNAGTGITVSSNDAVLGGMTAAGGTNDTATVYIGDGTTTGAANTEISTTIDSLSATALNLNTNNLTNSANAITALANVTQAINTVSAQRGVIGASVNRLTAATNVMANQVTNLQSAANGLQNADIGKTVANMTQYNVLQSTGMAALQQSNQAQQAVLKLVQ